ncbi:UDP-N-acetylmuramate--L-alanine ligase [Luteimicrobium subarcticum]|uniref:UDP-N-acetylmuramate--L-alanine ligase n=1 Tax=Luteimicrobium subarcticum TaxID=620910 RepID=A0A2M8WTZ7_9MICO|nr:UDP-N-acetylmuramate--L-alanine ligase [Luteimicrobium subarcticum]PJI94336.1 UDP-N-acetylmuramate--L-alanine ligase [Luteimicrobium subarcticum]
MTRAYDPTPTLADLGPTHLVGIGGAGVSVVARLLAASGVPVTGSDARPSATVDALRADGVHVHVGHDAAAVAGARTLVVSSAVRDDNPELVAARAAGLRVLHRSQALAVVMADRRGVAVAGAHGKTTTSAMLATVLREAGEDPSYAIGGQVLTDDGPLPGGHLGTGDALVAEADESDGSFLNYAPVVAVVTNVEPDHLDHYGSREAFEQAFDAFVARVRPGGRLVACQDDPGSRSLADRTRDAGGGTDVWTYGTDPASDVVVEDVEPVRDGGVRAVLRVERAGLGVPVGTEVPYRLAVPGAHNALNAAAAVLAAALLGVPLDAAAAAAGAFRGTGRRFEHRGTAGGVRVVDDYAHHPTEVAALLAAARPVAGEGRVVVLFQPHLYSRTRTFADDFAAALVLADEVVVTGVYAAREDPDPSTDASTIVSRTGPTASGAQVLAVEDRVEAARRAAGLARPGDLVLTVGAGDVTELADVVLTELAARGADAG